ncbi:SDR family oxidoreductase [Polynucleobacter sp. MWH-HuK1]|nr:SDR family oxidoreductase [Polynucleobacter sp. MWH-HuK1]
MKKLLVTGANGFVGERLCREAYARGLEVKAVTREACNLPNVDHCLSVGSIDQNTNWRNALSGCDVVVHLAARVHVMRETSNDSMSEFRKVNTLGTLNLGKQAAQAGVRRFVFVSSIKVNGELTNGSLHFACDDDPAPEDGYGVSKAEAEAGLWRLAQETGMEVVIIRPPLVYGPGVKGNFASLLAWVRRGLPLPLGAITQNRRSFVALDNLVDLILTCIDHPKAANQIFLVSDGEDLSTTELLQRIGNAMNRPIHLLPVPAGLLVFLAGFWGRRAVIQRLLGSLKVDMGKTCELLEWRPPVSVDEGLRRAVEPRV